MASKQYILDFYRQIAKHYGDSPLSTMEDQTIRDLETQFIIQEVQDFIMSHEITPRILDLGCGNGYLLWCLRQKFCEVKLFGLEFCPELYQIAKSRQLSNTQILCGDMCELESFPPGLFHIIITERSLINLEDERQQERALQNIVKKSSFPSRVISIESYAEAFRELNAARKEMGLPELAPSTQNIYLPEKKIKRWFETSGYFERKTLIPQNVLSSHFYHTRVLHPILRQKGARIKPKRFINFLNKESGLSNGHYSPILFKSFEKSL